MGLRPTKGMKTLEKTKSPVAYARGSEREQVLPNRDRKGVGAVGA